MHFYIVSQPVTLSTRQLSKFLSPVEDVSKAPLTSIFASTPGEVELVRKQIEKTEGEEAVAKQLTVLDESRIAGWQHFPWRLGRHSLGMVEPQKAHLHENDSSPLLEQLKHVAGRLSHQKPVRLLIVNGFGSNLGDTLLGATALRQVIPHLQEYLSSFSIDILLGPAASNAVYDLLYDIPEVSRVFCSAPSVAQFGDYDAYWDFSHLLHYPRYFDLPAVDFCLWWLGIEPETVHESHKRNRLSIPYRAWHDVQALLPRREGKVVLLSHKASVPLRTFPISAARRFVKKLLELVPTLTLVVDYTLEMKHPRLLDLDGSIDSADKLKALIAQVDGMIAVDSFPQHVADATASPTVLLCSSLPPSHYPYYPHATSIVVPGAESLPGWQKTKVEEADWEGMASDYESAWRKLDAKQVWQTLETQINARQEKLPHHPAQFHLGSTTTRTPLVDAYTHPNGTVAIKQRFSAAIPTWEASQQRLASLCEQLLHRGGHAIHAGAGAGELTLSMLERVGAEGRVAAFEPRRLYFQTLCAQAVLAGFDTLHAYQALPASVPDDGELPEVPALDLFSSHEQRLPGNSHTKVVLDCQPIDSLPWPMCRLLLIQPPMPISETLQGAKTLLRNARPIVVMSPLSLSELSAIYPWLAEQEYRLFQLTLPSMPDGTRKVLALAMAKEQSTQLMGFEEFVM